MRPEVLDALSQVLQIAQADPGRPYEEALEIRRLIEDARDSVASFAQVTPRQVIFTSSIAESTNHAVTALGTGGVILVSGAERSSVIETARQCGDAQFVPLTATGHLDLDALEGRLTEGDVSLVCAQSANHETGVSNDLGRIADLCQRHGTKLHVDASCTFGHLSFDVGALEADAVTVSSELLGGPQGVAALLVKKGTVLPPLLRGGAQERARRAGLENILGILGFGVACDVLAAPGVLTQEAAHAMQHLAALSTAACAVPGVAAVGSDDPTQRTPFLRCFTIDGIEAEAIVMGLDRKGISVHSGSACAAESLQPSPVLEAMGLNPENSLRLSVGWSTTENDIARFVDIFPEVIASLRALRSS